MTSGVDIAGFRVLKHELVSGNLGQKLTVMEYAAGKNISIALTTNCTEVQLISGFIGALKLDYLTIHAEPTPDVLAGFRDEFQSTKIIALRSYEASDDARSMTVPNGADYQIFDWARGGTGRLLDLDLLERVDAVVGLENSIVAGGLDHVNVVRLLERVTPFALDLDSSVRNPETRVIDPERVVRFVSAVNSVHDRPGSGVTEARWPELPFPDVDSPPWNAISDSILTDNHVVSNARLLSIIDDADRYRNAENSISRRITNALEDLDLALHPEVKDRWLKAALVAFSSTLYFPREMLNSSLRYLHRSVEEQVATWSPNNKDDFHLFSNDPGALHEDYFRLNEIHGRLDQEKHARVKGVEDLGRTISDLRSKLEYVVETAETQLRMILEAPVWVMLADQSLSGHSLSGDIEKILWLFNLRKEAGFQGGVVLAQCQIMTETAFRALKKVPAVKAALRSNELQINSAIFLGDEFSVLSETSAQIPDNDIRRDLLELCDWFASEFIAEDKRLKRMRQKSGDNLEYGYRKAGLLIARQENCPTDSLPLLWHTETGEDRSRYRGPFPRVHSRIDGQAVQRTASLWQELQGDQGLREQIKELVEG